jgi:hypothetical protein
VMLSVPDEAFGGGELQVGSSIVEAAQGDAYVYSAAVPHRVHPVQWGRRYTLIISLNHAHTDADHLAAYWQGAEGAFDTLARHSHGVTAMHKVHILHGEFLEGSGRAAEASAAFCRAYRATGDGPTHVNRFLSDGVVALQPADDGRADLVTAEAYFGMAVCIDPSHTEAAKALGMVRDALTRVG